MKLYLTKDVEDRDNLESRLGIELKEEPEDLEYVVGWESIDIQDICGFGTIFSRNKTIEDVKANGFDCTIVYLKYGKEIGCSWPPKKFEEKLNAFAENLEAYRLEQEANNFKRMAIQIPMTPKKKGFWDRFK